MERLDIHMVPCRVQFGDRGYLDKVSITTEEFYRELEDNPQHPTSSQPAPGDFRRQFQFLASHFRDVLSINLTSRASGTYEGARAAAKRCDAPGRIHVLDSLNASVGQGQLVVLAAECAAAGVSIDETIRIVGSQVPETRIFALLNHLSYAVRGGRLPRWVKVIADLARLTPVISIRRDGKVALSGFLLGRRNRIPRFARFVARRMKSRETVEISIGQAVCPEDANALAAELRSRIPAIGNIKICGMGTALGVHGGPGTLIVSVRPRVLLENLTVSVD
jgi:DegV family protein with EDD domain